MNDSWITTIGFYDSPVMLGANRIKLGKEGRMPILDLTDIDRPPRQGMLRLGIKKRTEKGKEYPAEVDYFIIDPETPDEYEKNKIIDLFHITFGDKPKTISIVLVKPDTDKEQFPQSYKRYGKNTGLKCIGDGESATCTENQYTAGLEVTGEDSKKYPTVKCLGRDCKFAVTNDGAASKECKATGTLSVKILALAGLGVWQVTTGSFNSIVNLNSAIRELTKTYGRAYDIPLKLERRPQETRHKGKAAMHYPLHLNTDGNMDGYLKKSVISMVDGDIPAVDDEVADGEVLEQDFKEADAHVTDVIEKTEAIKQKQQTKETIQKVADTFGAQEIIIQDHEKPELPGAAVAEQVKENRAAKTTNNKWPENFFEFVALARRKLQEAKLLDEYNKILANLGVKSPSELKTDDKQDVARIDIEELLEVNKIV